ncbi:MAG: hypothetical protein JXR96_28045 [Deltaproteobacteria bacterium]|nr:hypothetical protein [Deltaproteobacteria bacterium]
MKAAYLALLSWSLFFCLACSDGEAEGPASILAEPESLDFGTVPVGKSKQLCVSLSNPSDAIPIAITEITLAGSSDDFSYESEVMEILPGEVHEIAVTFAPSSDGQAQAALVVENSSANEPHLEIDLSGEAFECDPRMPEGDFMIVEDIIFGLADRGQDTPAVAFDGTNYLVVWADYRGGSHSDIYCSRVDREGAVLDPGGIQISNGVDSEMDPQVAFDGTSYLVVWDQVSGTSFDIFGARISTDGTLLDPEPFALCDASEDQLLPSMAFDGTNYMVAWLDNRDFQCDIYAARVEGSGTVLDPNGFPVSVRTDLAKFPALAFGQDSYLIAWQDERHAAPCIYGARVESSGAVLDPDGFRISDSAANQTFAAVAFGGNEFLVVWEDEPDGHSDLFGARIDSSGAVLDAAPIQIALAPELQGNPTVVFDGSDFFVAWNDAREGLADIYATWVDRSGSVLDTDGMPLVQMAESQIDPSAVFDGERHLVVFSDSSAGWSDISGARVQTDGQVLDTSGIHISLAVNSQYEPNVASNGSDYLVVWSSDNTVDQKDIYGALLDRSGAMIGQESFSISTSAGDQTNPAAASDGHDYLVAWTVHGQEDRGIHGVVLDRHGQAVEPGERLLVEGSVGNAPPGILFDGSDYFMVCTRSVENGTDVLGMWIDASGELREDAVAISTGEGDNYSVSAASDGQDYLVVWTWQRTPFDPRFVVGRRVSGEGEILDMAFLPITDIWTSSQPTVAFGGEYYLVAWQDTDNRDIYAVQVTTDGEILDGAGYLGISTADGEQSHPRAHFDGERILISWEDDRDPEQTVIRGARVDPDGTFYRDFLISHTESDALDSAGCANLCGDSLVVFSGWTSQDSLNAIRIFGQYPR